ncbi:MAG: ABC transporter permease [Firmicutes bacterium HGW-Firmicutes-16]|nr:MAG: ABC transporter permease [Firmicutes bacterium HGW-Firmicutes-16]
MYFRIIRNDIKKSKIIYIIMTLFVAAAAMLVSLAAVLIINLTGSIETLMKTAETPHFLQMHSGAIDTNRLEEFAQRNENAEEFQIIIFLNIDGAQIVLGDNSLAKNIQDNGFCTQSSSFDYVLDLEGNIINASDGELYVPICYMKDGTTKVGDRALICGKEFTVVGFLRDSQMNSTLAFSKRFIISETDFSALKSSGSIEYLIEFRLNDLSKLSAFETAYTSAGLEANGPTVTYPLFKMINALTDGMMIGVILLVSLLIVAVAFMCIRFTLLAKIEDDYREIGVMKAIGLRVSDIKRIYLAKYAAIAASGCVLGYALSFIFKGMLLENIRLYMGESGSATFASLLGIVGILLVFLAVTVFVNSVLRRFKSLSAAEAVRFGTTQEKVSGARHLTLSKNRLFNTNVFLGVKDVLSKKRLYVTMLAVLVISTFIIVVPQNLYSTISSKDFIKYMGVGECDIRLDIQQADDLPGKAVEISNAMDKDSSISKNVVLTTKAFKLIADDGTAAGMKIELGDHSIFPVNYSGGSAPVKADEIALSALNAKELGKKVGDSVRLVIGGSEKSLTVCGIYSDITNGGKTAKAVFSDESADTMWCLICAKLSDESLVDNKVLEYAEIFDYAKVSDVNEYILQTFGSTVASVKKASVAATAAALIISALITVLFMRMLIAKDRGSVAAMKALGFRGSDITVQYISRSAFVLIASIIVGTVLSNTLGELLAGAVISSFGTSSFSFIINPLNAYLVCPLLIICAVLAATFLGASGAGKTKISEYIKE